VAILSMNERHGVPTRGREHPPGFWAQWVFYFEKKLLKWWVKIESRLTPPPAGLLSPQMKEIVAKLTVEDMVSITAYTASPTP